MASRTQRFGPLLISKTIAKRALDVLQVLYVAIARVIGLVDYPVPPNRLMRSTSGGSIRHYFNSGMNCYLPLATSAKSVAIEFTGAIRVLDFGCGVGRQLLHFTRQLPSPEYFACDVNSDSVEFVRRAYPTVHSYTNGFSPPLKYAPDFFDMIYSVSVFSHLAPENHDEWLAELARVLKRGGYAFLTIEGQTALRIMGERAWGIPKVALEETLATQGVLYRQYIDLASEKAHEGRVPFGSKYRGIGSAYGSTVMSRAYVAEHWAVDSLRVVNVVEGVIDNRQDLVVLRRA